MFAREVKYIGSNIWVIIKPNEVDVAWFQAGGPYGPETGAAGYVIGRIIGKNTAKKIAAKIFGKEIIYGAGKAEFRTKELFEQHFAKHAGEFGNITKEQYLKGAQNLVNSKPGGDILIKTRSNGDTIFYNKATNEFAVKAKGGTIRTYFKPIDGLEYFNKQ